MEKNNEHTEKELLQLLRKGNEEAFKTIYNTQHSGIYNFLLKFTKNPALAADLVHDVFLKIWEAREQIDIKHSFAAYLYGIARNIAITQLNRASLYDTIRDEILHRSSLNINSDKLLNAVEARQYEALLTQAVAHLPPQRREAFILCRQEGKTYEEAAALMGISRNTIKQHLSLAVQSIKDYLLKYGDITLLMILMF